MIPLGSDKEKEWERERKGVKERSRKEEKRELNVISSENVLCGMGIVNPVLDVLGSTILDRRGGDLSPFAVEMSVKSDYSRIT